jgi:hypothetical protein
MQPRRHERHRTLLGGRIVFNNRTSTLDCRIRNMGDGGALLSLGAGHMTLPERFDLHIPHTSQTLSARMVWRAGSSVGVVFHLEERDAAGQPVDRLAQLSAENERLRARLAEMMRLAQEHGVTHVFDREVG